MKYPFVLFFRTEEYKQIDTFLLQNSNAFDCSIFITSDPNHIHQLHFSNVHLLLTYGDKSHTFVPQLPRTIATRYMQLDNNAPVLQNIATFNHFINSYFVSFCSLERQSIRPTFSLFTTTFNSYDKILRARNSILQQTLIDWEWVIVDDSPDDKHFQFLKDNLASEPRIRLFRKAANNGSIGYVKNEAVSLCRGKYLLEMDHDDEILPYVLQDAANYFDTHPDTGFIYFDFACMYEDGSNHWYGDFICKGYGGYYSQYIQHVDKPKWLLVYMTPNINNITMSHLVCCPNHPRIWRKDTLLALGNYCEFLHICDDYELLLRTSVSTQMAKIHKLGYIQYMNNSNNNFSLIRNAEINRLGPKYLYPIYYDVFQIHDYMKSKGAYEDEQCIEQHSKLWERNPDTYSHVYCNAVVNPNYDKQYCIIGLDSLLKNLHRIQELAQNDRNDFLLLDNKCTLPYLQERLERFRLTKVKCYTLIDTPEPQLIRYFQLLYLSCNSYEIINDNVSKPPYNTTLTTRFQVINKLTNPTMRYLEIGVEYGETFESVHFMNKTGVDPDPKILKKNILVLTSDDFFDINRYKYDVIFVDGMHQSEYVLRDVNNSINVLTNNCCNKYLFLDDILPLNYNEQLKVPIQHYYEKGILKYGENWTGDVWKVVYHLLKCYRNKIANFAYYYNINFRGIGVFQFTEPFEIKADEIVAINEYNYFTDFSMYVQLLNAVSAETIC